MARHGENIRKRKDGRWEGRYKAYDESRGRTVYRSLYGRTYDEVKEKLIRIRSGLAAEGAGGGKKPDEWERISCPGTTLLFSQAAER